MIGRYLFREYTKIIGLGCWAINFENKHFVEITFYYIIFPKGI